MMKVPFPSCHALPCSAPSCLFGIRVRVFVTTLVLLCFLGRHADIFLALEDIAAGGAILALPGRLAVLGAGLDDAEGPRVVVAWVALPGKPEASVDGEAGVAGEVADVPEGVGLAVEYCDDDGG